MVTMEEESPTHFTPTGDDEYLHQHDIANLMAQLTRELREHKPANPLDFMLQWLSRVSQVHECPSPHSVHILRPQPAKYDGDATSVSTPNTTAAPVITTAMTNTTTAAAAATIDPSASAVCGAIMMGDCGTVDPPELAVFAPVRDLILDAAPAAKCERSPRESSDSYSYPSPTTTTLTPTHVDSVAATSPVVNVNAWDHSPRCRDALFDSSLKTRGSSDETPPDAFFLRLPPTVVMHPLLDMVMRLPPSKHTVALDLLEELVLMESNSNEGIGNSNKNNNNNTGTLNCARGVSGVLAMHRLSRSLTGPVANPFESPLGTTSNRESNGMTSSEAPGRSSTSDRSVEATIAAGKTPLATAAHLQSVVNDALTASIVGRDGLDVMLQSTITAKTGSLGFAMPTTDAALTESTRSLTHYSSNREGSGTQCDWGTPHLSSMWGQSYCKASSGTPLSNPDMGSKSLFTTTETATEEELSAVRQTLAAYGPFSGLDETQLEGIIRSMERYELHAPQVRRDSSALVFVCSGTLQVEKEGHVLQVLSAGDLFGNLEIVQRKEELQEPVNFRALADGVLLSIRKSVFYFLIKNEKKVRRSMFLSFLNCSHILSLLSPEYCMRLADSLRVRNIKAGTVLLQEGKSVEWFSLVISGVVRRIVRNEMDIKESCSLTDPHDVSSPIPTNNNLLEITSGSILCEVEFFFHSEALTDAVAVTNVLVAQLHSVYFQAITPQHVMDEIKGMVATRPIASLLASRAREQIRREIEEVAKREMELRKVACETNGIHKQNPNTVEPLSLSASKRYSAHLKMTCRMGEKPLRSAGEIFYAGKHNFYRFSLCAIDIVNAIMIAVVADGTIIRWNAAADRATGFHPQDVLGQSIYRFLSTESARCGMRERLQQAHSFSGNWDSYAAAGFSSPFVYRFAQPSALCHVNLLLSVIPSCVETSADVMLLVGREADGKTAAGIMRDVTQWVGDTLQPQLRSLQRRLEALDARGWNVSQQEGECLCGHIQACNSLVKHYLRLSSLNMKAMNVTWKPVRIHDFVQQFSRDVGEQVNNAGNTLETTILEEVPRHEFFIDVDNALEVLKRLVYDANNSGSPVHIAILVSMVRATSSSSSVAHGKRSGLDMRRRASLIPPPGGTQNVSDTTPAKENIWLCSAGQRHKVIDGFTSSLVQHIRITVAFTPGESTSTANASQNCKKDATHGTRNFAVIKECDKFVTNMGGNLTFYTSRAFSGTTTSTIALVLPLLPVPWVGNDATEDVNTVVLHGSSLTVIVADRDSRQRDMLCELMWARRHFVVPATSYTEAMVKVKSGGVNILVIDPLQLEYTKEELEAFKKKKKVFDALQDETNLVVLLYTSDFNDWRVQKFMEHCHVVELLKPAYGILLHCAMQEAEHMVALLREDEKQIAQLRMAFTRLQSERYKVGKILGKGTFGAVCEVEDLLTGGKMAMKRMYLADGVLIDDAVQELLAMTSLRHENIIHYFGCQKESDHVLCLYMELAPGGTLQEKIRRHSGPLPLDAIVQHLQDLCWGIAYLHSENYVHGDIKTANALIDHHGRTKIGDFGTAKRLRHPSDKLYTFAGTPLFMAPELMQLDEAQGNGYNQKADIWSLGCIALELATGMAPFSYLKHRGGIGMFAYVNGLTDVPDLSPIVNGDALLYSFISSCLRANPALRPEAKELLTHELLQPVDSKTWNERVARHEEMTRTLKQYTPMDAEVNGDSTWSSTPSDDHTSYSRSTGNIGGNHTTGISADFVFGDRDLCAEEDTCSESSEEMEDEWTSVEVMKSRLENKRNVFFLP